MPDITPPEHSAPERSIRNIPVPEGRKHIEPMPQEFEQRPPRRNGRGKILLWGGIVIVACVVVGVLISTVFAGATVTVNPRTASVTPPSSVLAGLNAPAGSLSYKILTYTQSASRTVPASGTEQASSSAQGTVTIYNNYGTAPQELVATTRFQAPDGKIYRIHQGVVVPGATKNSDGTLSPGTVSATVYADAAGDSYNKNAQTRFTIPGFKNTPRYDKFYAVSDSITGGFIGPRPAIASSDKVKAETEMKAELQGGLQQGAAAHIPDGYMEIPGTLAVSYGDEKITDAGGGNATISQDATVSDAVIKSSDLASAIARLGVQGYNGEGVDFANPSGLSLSVASGTPFSPSSTSVTLALSGTANVVWQFDTAALQQALAGQPRSQFNQIVSTFAPAVAKATASLRPFWQNTFPKTPGDIKINIKTQS